MLAKLKQINLPIANAAVAMLPKEDTSCMHGQPGYISNCDICIKSMVTWQDSVWGKIQFSFVCILSKCGTVG